MLSFAQHLHHFFGQLLKNRVDAIGCGRSAQQTYIGESSGCINTRMTSNGNHAPHSLADIDDNSRETLEYIKHEVAKEYQISMSISGKTSKKLCARRIDIAKVCGWQRQRHALHKCFIWTMTRHPPYNVYLARVCLPISTLFVACS